MTTSIATAEIININFGNNLSFPSDLNNPKAEKIKAITMGINANVPKGRIVKTIPITAKNTARITNNNLIYIVLNTRGVRQ
jgi:hypothetical protein